VGIAKQLFSASDSFHSSSRRTILQKYRINGLNRYLRPYWGFRIFLRASLAERRALLSLPGGYVIYTPVQPVSFWNTANVVGGYRRPGTNPNEWRQIDAAFNLQGFFERFLNGARGALHSFTHSGLSQIGRRFKGNDLEADYKDGEIIEVIHTSSSAVFMVTNLVMKHFKFVDEKAEELFLEWGKH